MRKDKLAAVECGQNEQGGGAEDQYQGGEPKDSELNFQIVATEPADEKPESEGGAPGADGEQGEIMMIGQHTLGDPGHGRSGLGSTLAGEVGYTKADPPHCHEGRGGSIEPEKTAEDKATGVEECCGEEQRDGEVDDRGMDRSLNGREEVYLHGLSFWITRNSSASFDGVRHCSLTQAVSPCRHFQFTGDFTLRNVGILFNLWYKRQPESLR